MDRFLALWLDYRGTSMVKVYFDIHKGDELIQDLEGAEFDDLACAKRDAEKALHEMVGEDISNETPLVPRSISIRDESGTELGTVQLRAAVRMVQETKN
jgi:hypothetical protein